MRSLIVLLFVLISITPASANQSSITLSNISALPGVAEREIDYQVTFILTAKNGVSKVNGQLVGGTMGQSFSLRIVKSSGDDKVATYIAKFRFPDIAKWGTYNVALNASDLDQSSLNTSIGTVILAMTPAEKAASEVKTSPSENSVESLECDQRKEELKNLGNSLNVYKKSFPNFINDIDEVQMRLRNATLSKCVSSVTLQDFLVEVKSLTGKFKSNKKSTITCIKGKLTKKVTGINPKCPTGYKKK